MNVKKGLKKKKKKSERWGGRPNEKQKRLNNLSIAHFRNREKLGQHSSSTKSVQCENAEVSCFSCPMAGGKNEKFVLLNWLLFLWTLAHSF